MKISYPKELSRGFNNVVVALSDWEVGKLFEPAEEGAMLAEAEKMQYANGVNDLVVNFSRLDFKISSPQSMLVMERLYPLEFKEFELKRRQLWFEVFEYEIRQLHQAGFVHRDLLRFEFSIGLVFDNILLTEKGLRLVDVGISSTIQGTNDRIFQSMVQKELDELEQFKDFFLQ
jgi:serine/threonine protein kinase